MQNNYLRLIILNRTQILLTAFTKHRNSNHRVAAHSCPILDQHAIKTAHIQFLVHYKRLMLQQFLELHFDLSLLPLVALVERDFLRMRNQSRVFWTVLAFQRLLLGNQKTEGRRDQTQQDYGYEVPQDYYERALPSKQFW